MAEYLGTIGYLKSQLMASSALTHTYNNDNFKPGMEAIASQFAQGTFQGTCWSGVNNTTLIEPSVITPSVGTYFTFFGSNETSNKVPLTVYNNSSKLVLKVNIHNLLPAKTSKIFIYNSKGSETSSASDSGIVDSIKLDNIGIYRYALSYSQNYGYGYSAGSALPLPTNTWIYLFFGNCEGSTSNMHMGYSLDGKLWRTVGAASAGTTKQGTPKLTRVYVPVSMDIDLKSTRYEYNGKIVYGNDTVGVEVPKLPSAKVTQF